MTDIDTIRLDGQFSDIYVLIDEPTSVYTARANGAIPLDPDTYALTFDGGSGTLGNCLEDMTLLIGTSAGASDVGIARLRKAPIAGTFYIGADPSLQVADDNYLTVLDDFEIWAKHPNGALLDVDVAYSNQFTLFRPVPWFDGRYAVIDAGGTAQFDATRCWISGSSISAYLWTATGATSTTDLDTATPTMTYNTSGRYRVSLTVTAANGQTYTGYGYVYVRGANVDVITDAVIDGIELDAENGGVVRIRINDRPSITNGRRVIVFADDWYGVTPVSAGTKVSFGTVEGRENILMVGWIIGETIDRTVARDMVEFEIAGPLGVMDGVGTEPAGIQDTAFPVDEGQTPLSGWATMTVLTTGRGIAYLAQYRSTLARCADIYCEEWVWLNPKLVSEGDTLFSQLKEYASHGALTVRADRLGRIFIERDTQLYPVADRTANIPVACELVDADFPDGLSIIRRQRGSASMATAEGVIFLSDGSNVKVGGRSPGNNPSWHGRRTSLNDLAVATVGDVLELAGLLAGSQNQSIEAIPATLLQNNRLMDIAPRMFVTVTWNTVEYRCIPRRVRFERLETGQIITELDLEPEGSQWPSVQIDYPDETEPPVDPPTDPPDLPPDPPDDPPDPPDEPSDADAVVSTSDDVRTSDDFDGATPTWTSEL